MNGYVKIVTGLIVVAAPALFLASCTVYNDMPSAADNSLPATNSDVPKAPGDELKGPESGESDFATH